MNVIWIILVSLSAESIMCTVQFGFVLFLLVSVSLADLYIDVRQHTITTGTYHSMYSVGERQFIDITFIINYYLMFDK